LAAITDDAGTFAFPDLPPGSYTLVATRAAYVSSAYGAKAYGRGSGVPISLAAGQAVRDLTLKMIHGGVIAGTLRDAIGRPAANAELILMTARTDGGRRRFAAITQSARTNSRGEYRVFGLPPGDYVLRAQPPSQSGQPDLRPTTAAELEWARKAAAGSADLPPPVARAVTYSASYYPGTNDALTATPITLGPAEERLGVDFAFQLMPTSTISGRIAGPDGQVPRTPFGQLQIESSSATSFIDAMIGVAATGSLGGGIVRIGPDGKFLVNGIPPGRYKLIVRGSWATVGAPSQSLYAIESLNLNGQDVTDLDIRLEPTLSMSGTVVFEGEDPKAPLDATSASLALNSADREATSALELVFNRMSGTTPGRVAKDQTFSITGIQPGRYRFVASPPGTMNPFGTTTMISPDGWVMKSAMWSGRDIADGTFDLKRGDEPTGVVVTFTKAVTEIGGRILDASGQAAPGFPIVIFSTRPSDWVAGSRRVVSVKPASDGAYRIRGLPPGDYYLCALSDLDVNDLYDTAFLEQLASSSIKLTLADGERKTQDLKIGGGQ
jgi:hypothetical protein